MGIVQRATFNTKNVPTTVMEYNLGRGQTAILPQSFGGKMVSEGEAINRYKRSGLHLGIYNNRNDLLRAARKYNLDFYKRTPRARPPGYNPQPMIPNRGQGYV